MVERRFACTQCGACCNRAPELELGEAAALADVFVLRLMLRLYSLPRSLADYALPNQPRDQASAEFYQTKRLLSAFAASSWPAKVLRGGKVVDYTQYLSLSVLPLDLGTGACTALYGTRCSIYERRPLSCRSVPLHYSRAEAFAARDLDAFVAAPGYTCATGDEAPVVITAGAIVDAVSLTARSAALRQAAIDQRWKRSIVSAMKTSQHGLPTPKEVESQAGAGALSASMHSAWQVAVTAKLLDPAAARGLVKAQSALIGRTLTQSPLSEDARLTLNEMQCEYACVQD